jgi:hypothetical protein
MGELYTFVRAYRDEDFDELASWYEAWGQKVPKKEFLPSLGYIAEGVAAGFMYNVENKLGLIDFYISNPKSKTSMRDSALDHITRLLICDAGFKNLKAVTTTTKLQAIKERAKKHNFDNIGECTMLFRGI